MWGTYKSRGKHGEIGLEAQERWRCVCVEVEMEMETEMGTRPSVIWLTPASTPTITTTAAESFYTEDARPSSTRRLPICLSRRLFCHAPLLVSVTPRRSASIWAI